MLISSHPVLDSDGQISSSLFPGYHGDTVLVHFPWAKVHFLAFDGTTDYCYHLALPPYPLTGKHKIWGRMWGGEGSRMSPHSSGVERSRSPTLVR